MISSKMIENEEDLRCIFKHNMPVKEVILNMEWQQKERLLCDKCCKNNVSTITFKEFKQNLEKQQQQKLNKLNSIIQQNLDNVQRFQMQIENLRLKLIEQLEILTSMTKDWIQDIIKKQNSVACYSFLQELEYFFQYQRETESQTKQIDQLLNEMELINNPYIIQGSQLLSLIRNISQENQSSKYLNKVEVQQQLSYGPIYKCIFQGGTNLKERCSVLSFNNDSLLLAGIYNYIKVFNIKNGQLKQIQNYYYPTSKINCLQLFKKNGFFVSGASNTFSKLQSLNLIRNQKYIQLLGNSRNILCMQIQPTWENYVVTGGQDNLIKFWYNQNQSSQWVCLQTITEHQNSVQRLSFSPDGNQLLSAGFDNFILLMIPLNNYQWFIKQKIILNGSGSTLMFFNPFIFFFQPKFSQHAEMYIKDKESGNYSRSGRSPIQNTGYCSHEFFTLGFNHSKSIAISKNADKLNFFRYNHSEQLEFNLVQKVCFKENVIQVGISNDGELLATWDSLQKKILLWQYQN